MYILRLVIDN